MNCYFMICIPTLFSGLIRVPPIWSDNHVYSDCIVSPISPNTDTNLRGLRHIVKNISGPLLGFH